MPLVSPKQMLNHAKQNRYCLAGFDVFAVSREGRSHRTERLGQDHAPQVPHGPAAGARRDHRVRRRGPDRLAPSGRLRAER